MKIVSIIGARPQFVKAAAVSRVIRESMKEVLVHTGQHYDYGMSEVFFKELNIPEPDYNLEVGSGLHGVQTGQMLVKIEEVLVKEKPDFVMVYGDTNSTLAGALCAIKIHIPVAHVEAGLRSYKKAMPEEVNRVLTDNCSDILFCPTNVSVENLKKENICHGVYLVGDVMYDALLYNFRIAEKTSTILDRLSLSSGEYALATVHRAENTDKVDNLRSIAEAFVLSEKTIVFPIHPRTRKFIDEWGIGEILHRCAKVKVIEPLSYLDMLMLEKNARTILTDSGGVQKEAFLFGVPCVTLREETEWVETVEAGANILVGSSKERITEAISQFSIKGNVFRSLYGDGKAAEKIRKVLEKAV